MLIFAIIIEIVMTIMMVMMMMIIMTSTVNLRIMISIIYSATLISSYQASVCLITLELQFGDLHEPMRISASNERPGDWTSCLSLMLSCGLMSSYNDKRNTTAVIGNLLQADFNMDMARNDTNSDSKGSATLSSNGTHSLMVRVLSRVRWPPHTQIKTCIDGWLVKCAGVMDANTIRIPTVTGITTASTDKEDGDCGRIESRCLGLPLLINEARDLCMISSQRNSPSSLCHTLDTGFDISKRPIDIAGEAGRGGVAKFKSHNKYCTRKASSASLVAIESSFSDSVQSLIQSWGGLKRAADYVGDNEHFEEGDIDDDDQHQDCGYVSPLPSHSSSSSSSSSSYSQSVHIPTNKSHNSNGAGLCGVMACYAALHYASLSMHMDEVVGVSTSISASRVAEIMYMGPFVCDFRSLPIKTSIQYLLHKLRQSQSSDFTSSSIIPTPSVSTSLSSYLAGNTLILYSLVKLVQDFCPELLLSERSQCFRPIQIFPGNSSTVPNVSIKQSDDVSMNGDMIRSDVLLDFIEALISPKTEEKATPNHYSMACLLLAKSAFSTPHFISPTPTRIISSRLIQKLLSRASENKQSTQVSAGLWSIWRAVHSHYSLPQEIELITINHLINERMLEFHFRVLTSYEQLVQEPLLLFALPYPVLSEMFTLRLVIFITRAALCASRRAVHFALRLKHKTAEGFLTGGLRHRSVTEASLYLHEQTYIDLQELMAVRLVLGLWERWGDDEFASTRRLVLNDFLAALIADNPHLVNLLLCNQLTPRSFELLMSCDTAVAAAMSSCHLQDLQSTTLALKTLPQQSALVVDQSITSSSLLYTTSVTAASLLATDLEISPEYVERLLLHSLCLLKMMKYLGCDRSIPKDNKNLEKSILSIQLLAEALPPFLVSATNSLNKNLRSKEVKSIELYSEAIISYLYMFHPVCVTAFKNFISCTDKIVTANTAAIGLAMKAPGGKAHVRDDDSVVGGRPAIIALKKIIQRIDSSHLQPQRDPLVREEGNHNQQHVSSVTSAVGQGGTGDTLIGAISHKTNRSVEDCHGTSDEYPGRKKSRIGTQSSE